MSLIEHIQFHLGKLEGQTKAERFDCKKITYSSVIYIFHIHSAGRVAIELYVRLFYAVTPSRKISWNYSIFLKRNSKKNITTVSHCTFTNCQI